jgi:hypothetical protein
MKVYYFTVIAIGLMLTLYLGGIDTTSSQIITGISGQNPSFWQSSALWIALAAALGGFIATSVRIGIGSTFTQVTRESVVAGLMTVVYVIFASDMYSIITKVKSIECTIGQSIVGCGSWILWTIWVIINALLVAYALAIIEFIGGHD